MSNTTRIEARTIEDTCNLVASELTIQEKERMSGDIDNIALLMMNVETLKTRYSDDQDFPTVAIWTLKQALQEAYLAGRRSK